MAVIQYQSKLYDKNASNGAQHENTSWGGRGEKTPRPQGESLWIKMLKWSKVPRGQ